MIITKIEVNTDKKVNVYLDGEYYFFLFQSEIKKYKLKEGMELSPSFYNMIIEEIVYNRAKQKAVNILKYMDRTEYELKQKLKHAGYKEEIVNRIISYFYEYNYLDDRRFAYAYIERKKSSKSLKQIEMELRQKGVSREIIQELLENQKGGEEEALKKIIEKKLKGIEKPTKEQKQKISMYLYRKGYPANLIRQYLFDL